MWLTQPIASHSVELVLDCQKRLSQNSSPRGVEKILNFLNKQSFVAGTTVSTRYWGLQETFS